MKKVFALLFALSLLLSACSSATGEGAVQEATKKPESDSASEPIKESAPVEESKPVKESEPVKESKSNKKPEPVKELDPAWRPVSKPEPVEEPEPPAADAATDFNATEDPEIGDFTWYITGMPATTPVTSFDQLKGRWKAYAYNGDLGETELYNVEISGTADEAVLSCQLLYRVLANGETQDESQYRSEFYGDFNKTESGQLYLIGPGRIASTAICEGYGKQFLEGTWMLQDGFECPFCMVRP